MVRVKTLALAGATALLTTAATAADFPPVMPQPLPVVREAAADVGGWYLRGDVGIGVQDFKSFDHNPTNTAFVWPASWRIDQQEIKSAPFIGFGLGYAFNSWFRVDVTGEYRSNVPLKVLGSYTEFCPGGRCFDLYDGNQSAWVTLVNAYLDLGTWWCVTPFIGAGVGAARTTIASFSDVGYISDGTTGFGYAANDHSQWNFAWALHAGLGYDVTNKVKVEFAYRYLNMGDVRTSTIACNSAGCAGGGPRASYDLTNFHSHDLKLGVRWMLQPDPVPVSMPLMRRG
jgi:opacity protein-like surface antigen